MDYGTYIKVFLEGYPIGRKVCLTSYVDYDSLALKLDEMFGHLVSPAGLRLFEDESKFALLYMNDDEFWGDAAYVSWKEFVDCARRLKITKREFVDSNF